MVEALINLETTDYSGEKIDAATQAEIRAAVKNYRTEIAEAVADTAKLSQLYKQLAKKYMELSDINNAIARLAVPGFSHDPPADDPYYFKMLAVAAINSQLYHKAYTSLQAAIAIDAANPTLYYLAGVCAGWVGKSLPDPKQAAARGEWYRLAEEYYKRACELKPGYVDALYGLAVLLIFETGGSPEEAAGYVKQILAIEKTNLDAMFLAAVIHDEQGEYEQAILQYDEIMAVTKSAEIQQQARTLKAFIEDKLYGSE